MTRHTTISLIKSVVRIVGVAVALTTYFANPATGFIVLCISITLAEVLGIVEELDQ